MASRQDDKPRKKRVLQPYQQRRNECLSHELKGKHFPDRMAQRQAFTDAIKLCHTRYPKPETK